MKQVMVVFLLIGAMVLSVLKLLNYNLTERYPFITSEKEEKDGTHLKEADVFTFSSPFFFESFKNDGSIEGYVSIKTKIGSFPHDVQNFLKIDNVPQGLSPHVDRINDKELDVYLRGASLKNDERDGRTLRFMFDREKLRLSREEDWIFSDKAFQKEVSIIFGQWRVDRSYQIRPLTDAVAEDPFLYTLEKGQGWIDVYMVNNFQAIHLKTFGEGFLQNPLRMAINKAGTIFVYDAGKNAIIAFEKNGEGEYLYRKETPLSEEVIAMTYDPKEQQLYLSYKKGGVYRLPYDSEIRQFGILKPTSTRERGITYLSVHGDELYFFDSIQKELWVVNTQSKSAVSVKMDFQVDSVLPIRSDALLILGDGGRFSVWKRVENTLKFYDMPAVERKSEAHLNPFGKGLLMISDSGQLRFMKETFFDGR